MASCSNPVKFSCVCKNACYFESEDVDSDSFKESCQHPKLRLQSKDNKFLFLNDGQFQAQHLSIQDQLKPDSEFTICSYSNGDGNNEGRAVMLCTKKDGKNIVACCKGNEIYPEEMDPPKEIDKPAHKAMFYLRQVESSVDKFTFESSMYRNKFLGFKPVDGTPGQSTLVLNDKTSDEVDEVILCNV